MIKQNLLLLLLFITAIGTSFAQDNKSKSAQEWQKELLKEMQQLKSDQNKEMQDMSDERTKYIQRMDAEFSNYLKERWQEFHAFKGVKSSENPKPILPPVAKSPVVTPPVVKVPEVIPPSRPFEQVAPLPTKPLVNLPFVAVAPVVPVLPTTKNSNFPTRDINFSYYGTPIRLQYDLQLDAINMQGVTENEIGKAWSELCKINYAPLVKDLFEARNRMNLNDWGYYQLIRQFSDNAFQKDSQKSKFIAWFLLTKSGFKAKLGRAENQFLLMVSMKSNLYAVSFITIDDVKYYILSNYSNGSLFTYKNDFPEATHMMDMAIPTIPTLALDLIKTTVKMGEDSLVVKTNKNLLAFYNDYPQCDLDVYFGSQPSKLFRESIANITHGRTGDEALAYLLSFIQHLNYQTDTEQFGKEKFMFPDEFFFFPASDCDDRATLFAYLSKEFVHFNAIGLNYTEHVSTAIAIPERKSGDYVIYKNIRYTSCDPTYVGADVGMTMPKFKKASANIIVP